MNELICRGCIEEAVCLTSLLLMEGKGESLCYDAGEVLTSRTYIKYKMSCIDCQVLSGNWEKKDFSGNSRHFLFIFMNIFSYKHYYSV